MTGSVTLVSERRGRLLWCLVDDGVGYSGVWLTTGSVALVSLRRRGRLLWCLIGIGYSGVGSMTVLVTLVSDRARLLWCLVDDRVGYSGV
ncbi:hypothetical protein chiPu_0030041 [Chiloscyllium punctatum]|uniref:Transmembrane protein n=1 Tax=Chiloscyllium punctatum TaxID=137246 RepID=A0A401TTS6_CHIPU|nr:hypothetical protein [Chiloscyllium punctatum]